MTIPASLARWPSPSLRPIVEQTGLRWAHAVDGSLILPFEPERARRLYVHAAEVGDGLTVFRAPLPRPRRFRERAVLCRLLRVSFDAGFAKAVALGSGELALACELPTAVVTPGVADGLIKGLAELADMKRRDLADDACWERAQGACRLCHALDISLDAEWATARIRSLGGQYMEQAVSEGPDGELLLRLDVGLGELEVVARATPQAVSLIARLRGLHAEGDTRFMRGLLELNAIADVAKVGLDGDGDLALMYEVPEITPDLLEQASAQFRFLLVGTIALDRGRDVVVKRRAS